MDKKTKKDMLVEFEKAYLVFIPQGSATSHNTACGPDKAYNFLKWNDGIKVFYKFDLTPVTTDRASGFMHDFTYRGINLKGELVE